MSIELKTYYQELAEELLPDGAADLVPIVDTSGNVLKMVTPNNLVLGGSGGLPIFNLAVGFGAPVGGTGDITSAMASAITAVEDAGGGIILVPSGTFTCDSLDGVSNLTIRGCGKDTVTGTGGTTLVGGDDAHIFKFNGVNDVVIEDIRLKGDVSNTNSIGVLFEGVYAYPPTIHFDISRVSFETFKDGVKINATDGTLQIQQLNLLACDFIGNTRSGFYSNSSNNLVNLISPNMIIVDNAWGVYAPYIGMMNVFGGEWSGTSPSAPTTPAPPDPTAMPNAANAEGCFYFGVVGVAANLYGIQDEGLRYFIRHDTAFEDGGKINMYGCSPQSLITCANGNATYEIFGGNLMSYGLRDESGASGVFNLHGVHVKRRSIHDNATINPPVVAMFNGNSIVGIDATDATDYFRHQRQIPLQVIHPSNYDHINAAYLSSYSRTNGKKIFELGDLDTS
jgi:hypothetical protein